MPYLSFLRGIDIVRHFLSFMIYCLSKALLTKRIVSNLSTVILPGVCSLWGSKVFTRALHRVCQLLQRILQLKSIIMTIVISNAQAV